MKNKPVRVYEGSQKPFEPFWRVVDAAESDSGETEIEFYGYISEYSWLEDDITPAKFKADLAKLGNKPITIRVHSGGGDVYAASAIRAMIMDYPGKVTARIDGLCASAATYVAMAADHVKMQDSAFFMIHNPWMFTWGDEEELKAAANFLKKIKAGIVETYQSKTSLDAEKLSKMMSAETWMTAKEAQENGFVDEVISESAKSFDLKNAAVLNALRNYENVPPMLLNSSDEQPVITEPSTEGEGENLIQPDEEKHEEDPEMVSLREYLKIFG
ncbi:MAG: peptidase [Anaerolineaceae bacterium]|nr:peptidase [Anaerolineaceae bacterium]